MFPTIELSGEPFERGRQHGSQAIDRIKNSINCYEALFAKRGVTWVQVGFLFVTGMKADVRQEDTTQHCYRGSWTRAST